jgi:hypothetical protein
VPFIGRGGSSPPSDTGLVQSERLWGRLQTPFANDLLTARAKHQARDRLSRVGLHRRRGVAVDVEGYRNVGVA